MSESLSLTFIPPNQRVPLTYFAFSGANAGPTQDQQNTLIIGDSYNAVANVVTFIPSLVFAGQMFGIKSPLYLMIAAYLENDPSAALYALPLTHATGATAATGSITLTGTATAAGTLSLYVGGVPVPVAVNLGDTPTVMSNNISTAVNANTSLPLYCPSGGTGTVPFTASNFGLAAGQIDLRFNYYGVTNNEALPAGVTVAVTQMSGGTSNPSLAALATTLGSQPFDFIICEYNDATSVAALVSLLNDSSGRWAPSIDIFGHAFVADLDTSTNLLTYGAAQNNQHLTVWGCFNSPTPAWVWGAAHTGAVAGSLRVDPPRPLQTLQVQGVLAPPQTSQFNKATNNTLLNTGIALSSFDQGGNTYVLRAVTTYQFNALGQSDQSYLDTETLFTLMLFTRTLTGAINTKFARSKLADNGTSFGAGQAIVTPNIIAAELIAQYQAMEIAGLVEDSAAFAAGLIVVRNASNPSRVDVLLDPYLVSGLRIFAALTQFYLNSAAQ